MLIRTKTLALGLASAFALTAGVANTASAQEMPALPKAIEDAGVIRVGTKCDYPPEGFLDNSGEPVGVEVAMAHQIAQYAFGDDAEAEIVCVTSANRVPALVGNKVDLLIATMAVDPERAKVVAFSEPYAWASQGVIVRADDEYQTVDQLADKPIVFVKGATAIPYFEQNYPNVSQLQLDGVSDSIQSLMQGRVEAYAHDTAILMSLTAQNSRIRLLDDQFKITERAVALRPGEDELLAYVNASLDRMAADGKFREWFEEYANDENMEVKLNFWDMSKKPAE